MAWDERARTYAEGKCAVLYEWAGRAYIHELDETSAARGNTVYIGAPAKEGVQAVTPTGGWFLGIPSNIAEDRKELAWEFIQWMTSPEMLKFSALNGNGTMPSYSVMRDPELVAMYPAFPVVDQLGQDGTLQAWMRPAVPEFQQLSDLFGTVFHDMLAGKIAPADAIAKAQADADQMMKDAGYY
jgi:multiple sugar transport system substrate-binding protein